MVTKLTDMKERFAEEYLVDLNATQSAIRAGYSPKTAAVKGSQLLADPKVAEKIRELKKERSDRVKIDQDDVLQMWVNIATADYNEISQIRRVNCRYCWGEDHYYQWTPREYERACEVAIKQCEPEPENIGGLEFQHDKEPNTECPECRGMGIEHLVVADTTKLSHQGKFIFQGVKETKYGIEVNTIDRMKAIDNIAKHLGMFTEKHDHTSSDGSMTPVTLTPEIAKAIDKELEDEY